MPEDEEPIEEWEEAGKTEERPAEKPEKRPEEGPEEPEEETEQVPGEWACKTHGRIDAPLTGAQGKPICPVCKKFLHRVPPSPPPTRETGVKPPHIRAQDEAIKYLEEQLPNIYGISAANAEACIRRLKDKPEILQNPSFLEYHIKQYASKNLNEYDLQLVLAAVYDKLREGTAGPAARPVFLSPINAGPGPAAPPPVALPAAPQQPQAYPAYHHAPPPALPQLPAGPPQYQLPQYQHTPAVPAPRAQGGTAPLTLEDLERFMDERERRREEREAKRAQERKLDAVITLLRGHEADIERLKADAARPRADGASRPIVLQPAGKTANPDDPAQKFLNIVVDNAIKEFQNRSKEPGGMVIRSPSELREFIEKAIPKAPPGSIGPYDAEVRKAELEREARIAEAEAKKEAWAILGREIRSGLSDLGLGVGRGIAEPATFVPAAHQSGTPAPAVRTTGTVVTDEHGNQTGLLQIPCPNPDCDATIYYQQGRSRVKCPKCGQEYVIAPQA